MTWGIGHGWRAILCQIPLKETIVESSTDLAAAISAVMRDRKLDRQGMAEVLGIGDVMVDKLLCGEIVASRSLEKQLIEKMGMKPSTARRLTPHGDSKKPFHPSMGSKRAA